MNDRLSAALADRYLIERELGQGGMATVYLAQDIKHKRKVAIKVLKPELAAVLGAERFVQEITTTAALQHPHILPLFDSGSADGFLYYVMPFIDGETLRTKLDRETQLGIDEAVRITTDVASALHYAHQHGVIHRDIKPENILLHDGRPMVADFGIALAVSAAAGGRMTETGLSLGTPHYMSPEQATAEKEITARSDVYSLGSVLYEMLTGNPPHTGASAQQIIMKIVTEDAAPVTKLRRAVPPNVAAAVAKSLEKLPADRFESAKAFGDALTNSSFRATVATGGYARSSSSPLVSRLTPFVLVIAALGLAAWFALHRPPAPSVTPVQFVLTGKGAAEPVYTLTWPATVSPDGHTVIYAGSTGNGTYQLYVRDISRIESRPVPGTIGALQPVFSPDGQSIAFQSGDGKIKKVRLDGGALIPLVEYAEGNGMAWSSKGSIVVGASAKWVGLSLVSENGGALTHLTKPDTTAAGPTWHVWPVMLADGKSVVFAMWNPLDPTHQSELALTSLDDGAVHPLGVMSRRALGVSGDYLIYLVGEGVVTATRIDLRHYRVQGSPVALIDSIPMCPTCNGDAAVNLSMSGALTYMRGAPRGHLIWKGRDHVETPVGPDAAAMRTPRLSPDGSHIAMEIDANGRKDIWVVTVAGNSPSKLTNAGDNSDPEWVSDHVIQFLSDRDGRMALWRQAIDNSSGAEKMGLSASGMEWGAAPSPDQQHVVVQTSTGAAINLATATVTPGSAREIFVGGDHSAWAARFSPSGKSVAYTSDVSGRSEVYIKAFPGPGEPKQISLAGGLEPVWSRDGVHLYYAVGNQMTVATLTPEPGLSVVSRDSLFSGPFFGTILAQASYDVAKDGRFLLIKPNDEHFQLVVSLNWAAELAARLGKR